MVLRQINTLRKIKRELEITKFRGAVNTCPKCQKSGEFGSVVRYLTKLNTYLICGWCGKTTKIKNKSK